MSSKVKCELCGKEGNILLQHVRKIHGMSVERYEAQYPNSPLVSKMGRKKLDERKVAKLKLTNTRETVWVSIRKTFGIDFDYQIEEDANGNPIFFLNGDPKYSLDSKGKKIPKDSKITAFRQPGEHTPEIDESYVFQEDSVMAFLIGLDCQDRVLLTGPTGSGKSTLPEQIAARLNYNFVRINFSGGLLREDLVGTNQYHPEKGTYFQEGLLSWAMKQPGTIICLDEWDTISAECSFVLQRPLEKTDGTLLLLENGGEVIKLHEQSFICATGNTIGLGDESGLYAHGTTIQNYAQLNRFGITIFLDYISPELEAVYLNKKFIDDNDEPILDTVEVECFTKTMKLIRDGFTEGTISVPLSTRDLTGWVEKFLLLSDVRKAAQWTFLNRMPKVDAQAVSGIIQRVFELK